MILTVHDRVKELKLAIDDKHAERIVTLPGGITERLGNLDGASINLTPSLEPIGVPATIADPLPSKSTDVSNVRYRQSIDEAINPFEESE